MSGCLIDPKTRDRIVRKCGTRFGQFRDCLGGLCDNSCYKLWFRCLWAGNGHGFRFHKVELMLGEWTAHRQPTACLGTVKTSPGLLGWTEIGPCVFQEKYCLNWMA